MKRVTELLLVSAVMFGVGFLSAYGLPGTFAAAHAQTKLCISYWTEANKTNAVLLETNNKLLRTIDINNP